MAQVVEVSAGEAELFWVRVSETSTPPKDVDAGQVTVSLTPISTGVHTWVTPDEVEQVDDSTVRAAVLVDDRFAPGTYRLHARIVDSPETVFVVAEHGRVDVH